MLHEICRIHCVVCENPNHAVVPLHPLIVKDLQQHPSTPIDIQTFLKTYLPSQGPRGSPAAIDLLSSEGGIQKLLKSFLRTGGPESGSYQPFVSLANAIMGHLSTLELLGRNPKLKFCRQGPKCLRGSKALRKPDVVLVREDAKQLADSMDLPNGPEPPFFWDVLYCCVEFEGPTFSVPREKKNPNSHSLSLAIPCRTRGSKRQRRSTPVTQGEEVAHSQPSSRSASGSGSNSKRPADDFLPRSFTANLAGSMIQTWTNST